MTSNYVEMLRDYIQKENYPKIYIVIKQILSQIRDAKISDEDTIQFLYLFNEKFELIAEKEHEKKNQMRMIVSATLNEAFDENTFKNENQNQDFFKEKIFELLRNSINIFLNPLYSRFSLKNEDIKDIIIKMIDRFPEEMEKHFTNLFENFSESEQKCEAAFSIIDKFIDISPKLSLEHIFRWFNSLKDSSQYLKSDKKFILTQIFRLFKTYCEIYPEYFAPHLELMLENFLDLKHEFKNQEASENFAFIVYYFAKHGEYAIIDYMIELYDLALESKGNIQRFIILAIKEIVENYPEEIAQKVVTENNLALFDDNLLEIISKIDERQILDLLIDFFMSMNYEILVFIHNVDSDEIKNYSEEIDPSKIVLNYVERMQIYLELIEKLMPELKNHTYLCFKSIAEIDKMLIEMKDGGIIPSYDSYSNKYLKNHKSNEDKDNEEIKSTLEKFILDVRKYLDQIKKSTIEPE